MSELSFQRIPVQLSVHSVEMNKECVADDILMIKKKMSEKQPRQNLTHLAYLDATSSIF